MWSVGLVRSGNYGREVPRLGNLEDMRWRSGNLRGMRFLDLGTSEWMSGRFLDVGTAE